LVLGLASVSCAPSHRGTQEQDRVGPSSIQPGQADKDWVLRIMGNPQAQSRDGRFFLYRYTPQAGAVSAGGGSGTGSYHIRFQNTIALTPREQLWLIGFDETGTVNLSIRHKCKDRKTGGLCEADYPLCAMLKKLKNQNVVDEYCQ
jgi:hypothetical protein